MLLMCACALDNHVSEQRLMTSDDFLQDIYTGDTYIDTQDGIHPSNYIEQNLQIIGNLDKIQNKRIIVSQTFYDNHILGANEKVLDGNHNIWILAKTEKGIFYTNYYHIMVNSENKTRQNLMGGYPIDTEYHFIFDEPMKREDFDKRMNQSFEEILYRGEVKAPYVDDKTWNEVYYQFDESIVDENGEDLPIQITLQVLYSMKKIDGIDYVYDVVFTRELYYNMKDTRYQFEQNSSPLFYYMNDDRTELHFMFIQSLDGIADQMKEYEYIRKINLK